MEKRSHRNYDIYMKNVHIKREPKVYNWDLEIKVTEHVPAENRVQGPVKIDNLNEAKEFLQAYLRLRNMHKMEINENHFGSASNESDDFERKEEKKVIIKEEDNDSFKTSSSWGSFSA